MSRTAAKVTQADVARALRAAEQVASGRVVVEVTSEGTIRIVLTPNADAAVEAGKQTAGGSDA
jgi:hypothetical protein